MYPMFVYMRNEKFRSAKKTTAKNNSNGKRTLTDCRLEQRLPGQQTG